MTTPGVSATDRPRVSGARRHDVRIPPRAPGTILHGHPSEAQRRKAWRATDDYPCRPRRQGQYLKLAISDLYWPYRTVAVTGPHLEAVRALGFPFFTFGPGNLP
jgi:hypothetical protein